MLVDYPVKLIIKKNKKQRNLKLYSNVQDDLEVDLRKTLSNHVYIHTYIHIYMRQTS